MQALCKPRVIISTASPFQYLSFLPVFCFNKGPTQPPTHSQLICPSVLLISFLITPLIKPPVSYIFSNFAFLLDASHPSSPPSWVYQKKRGGGKGSSILPESYSLLVPSLPSSSLPPFLTMFPHNAVCLQITFTLHPTPVWLPPHPSTETTLVQVIGDHVAKSKTFHQLT